VKVQSPLALSCDRCSIDTFGKIGQRYGKARAQTSKGLRPRGRIIALGATPDPIEVSTTDLLFGNRSIEVALTGDPAAGDATLRLSALTGVAAMIETMPLEKAPEAYARMMAGKARFRMVLTMQS
jgi:alcohol dehydrogenase, propanol-preferring